MSLCGKVLVIISHLAGIDPESIILKHSQNLPASLNITVRTVVQRLPNGQPHPCDIGTWIQLSTNCYWKVEHIGEIDQQEPISTPFAPSWIEQLTNDNEILEVRSSIYDAKTPLKVGTKNIPRIVVSKVSVVRKTHATLLPPGFSLMQASEYRFSRSCETLIIPSRSKS